MISTTADQSSLQQQHQNKAHSTDFPPDVQGLITQVPNPSPPTLEKKDSNINLEPTTTTHQKTYEKTQPPKRKNMFKKVFEYLLCTHLCSTVPNKNKKNAKRLSTKEIKVVPQIEVQNPVLSKKQTRELDATGLDEELNHTKDQLCPQDEENTESWLLKPITKANAGRKLLVLDLDETLVHSSFKLIDKPDFIVPVEIDNQTYNVYVSKRPGVDEFLEAMGEIYEVAVFTASLAKYADPVMDILDKNKVVQHRLFRESCTYYEGSYVKDLSKIGRPLNEIIIIDNSPASYAFHPQNAVPVTSWFNDEHDSELLDLIPYLRTLSKARDVMQALDMSTKIKENASQNSSNPLPLVC